MKITKKTVKSVVSSMKTEGKTNQEIENVFKAALKIRAISLDTYCAAMEEIYK